MIVYPLCPICDEELEVEVSPKEILRIEGCDHAQDNFNDAEFCDLVYDMAAEVAQDRMEDADLERYERWRDRE